MAHEAHSGGRRRRPGHLIAFVGLDLIDDTLVGAHQRSQLGAEDLRGRRLDIGGAEVDEDPIPIGVRVDRAALLSLHGHGDAEDAPPFRVCDAPAEDERRRRFEVEHLVAFEALDLAAVRVVRVVRVGDVDKGGMRSRSESNRGNRLSAYDIGTNISGT